MDIEVRQSVHQWLDEFAMCVREKDFSSGRKMFSEDVIGFGTWTGRMVGMEDLLISQWSNVWSKTEGFEFDEDYTDFWCNDAIEPTQCTVAALWKSTGIGEDGRGFERKGRSTIVLKRHLGNEWRAIHSHFSFFPHNNLSG